MNYEEAVNYFLDIPRFAAKKHDLSGLRRFLEELDVYKRQEPSTG